MVFSRDLPRIHLKIGGAVDACERGLMHLPKDEIVPCYHCGRAIYFTAAECSHCGSRKPGGPDVFSRKEIRQRVIEARHDHTLAMTTLACGASGILYGSLKSGILVALAYGLFGLAAGVLIGLAIVITTWAIASEPRDYHAHEEDG
jgi:hypothetical protein